MQDEARQSALLSGALNSDDGVPHRRPSAASAASVEASFQLPKGASGAVLLAYELLPLPHPLISDKDPGGLTSTIASSSSQSALAEPLDSDVTPLPSLRLTTRRVELKLLVLSLQGLNGAGSQDLVVGALGIRRPFVEFLLDERAGPGSVRCEVL